jgi:hypothetical protein
LAVVVERERGKIDCLEDFLVSMRLEEEALKLLLSALVRKDARELMGEDYPLYPFLIITGPSSCSLSQAIHSSSSPSSPLSCVPPTFSVLVHPRRVL